MYEGDNVFVMWNWTWVDEISSDEESNGNDSVAERSPDESNSDDDDADSSIPSITHSVIFNCIGNLKEARYQEVLALANKKRNDSFRVPVKIVKELNNPVDARAIAFMCHVDQEWERIGYVVQEVLDDVHTAIDEKKYWMFGLTGLNM